MATLRQVKCVVQLPWKDRHERITHLGGEWGKVKAAEAITHIEKRTYTYYVRVGKKDVKIIVAESSGKKYLKTKADSVAIDNLLSSRTCAF